MVLANLVGRSEPVSIVDLDADQILDIPKEHSNTLKRDWHILSQRTSGRD